MRMWIEELERRGDIEGLIKALWDRSKGWKPREEAAEALGNVGDSKAVEHLIKALNDRQGVVRLSAARALEEIGDKMAVEPLILALKEGDRYLAWNAAEALGKIGDPSAIPALIRATKSNDFLFSKNAEEALGEIGSSDFYKQYRKSQIPFNIVTESGFKVGVWQELCVNLLNTGESDIKNIELSLSGTVKVGPVLPVQVLKSKERKEMPLSILPTTPGNMPLSIKVSFLDEYGIPIEINDVAYINVAKESETVSMQPQTIFNIGSIGEILGTGAVKQVSGGDIVGGSKTGDIGMVKGNIGSTDKPFSRCPYCGEALNLPKTPKFCPYCGEQLN